MAYIFGFENSSWYYMIYSSEIIGTAPGHWIVKLIQSFLPWFFDPFMLFLVKTQEK